MGATRVRCYIHNPRPERAKIHMVKVRLCALVHTLRLYPTCGTVSQTFIVRIIIWYPYSRAVSDHQA